MPLVRTAALLPILMCSGCIPYHLQETPTVTGSVMDAATRQPIAGAKLHYEKYPDRVVLTSNDGVFAFPAIRKWQLVPLGPYDRFDKLHLRVDAVGYRTGEVELPPWGDSILHVFYLDQGQ